MSELPRGTNRKTWEDALDRLLQPRYGWRPPSAPAEFLRTVVKAKLDDKLDECSLGGVSKWDARINATKTLASRVRDLLENYIARAIDDKYQITLPQNHTSDNAYLPSFEVRRVFGEPEIKSILSRRFSSPDVDGLKTLIPPEGSIACLASVLVENDGSAVVFLADREVAGKLRLKILWSALGIFFPPTTLLPQHNSVHATPVINLLATNVAFLSREAGLRVAATPVERAHHIWTLAEHVARLPGPSPKIDFLLSAMPLFSEMFASRHCYPVGKLVILRIGKKTHIGRFNRCRFDKELKPVLMDNILFNLPEATSIDLLVANRDSPSLFGVSAPQENYEYHVIRMLTETFGWRFAAMARH